MLVVQDIALVCGLLCRSGWQIHLRHAVGTPPIAKAEIVTTDDGTNPYPMLSNGFRIVEDAAGPSITYSTSITGPNVAVPKPASLALLSMGAAAIPPVRRRGRRA